MFDLLQGLWLHYELLLGYICFRSIWLSAVRAKPTACGGTDIWSLGVILFMLVCGQPPFQEANDSETLTMIMDCKYTVPAHVSNACKE
ncbi:hypothetical protein DNTS_030425 [Danionella cerebrum]|uniref:non-specific serine/threonine protein kinase n=1 Tax=Danionella cerebrum TaxID=2873325 RepID=A0A553RF57_9TELE|nr:hypothetical protein DNTS_030425 [Danionella translucida]